MQCDISSLLVHIKVGWIYVAGVSLQQTVVHLINVLVKTATIKKIDHKMVIMTMTATNAYFQCP